MSVRRHRVLVVDDSITAQEFVVRELSAEFDCERASSGQEALSLLAAKPIDAVISDLAMQGMGGVELLKAMKASPSTSVVPVIVVTTSTSVDAMNSCRALGCAGFVLKPVDVSYLKAKLRRLFA